MASYPDIVQRWLDVLAGRTYPANGRPMENYGSGRMYGRGHVLYSYGSHFPLAEYYGAGRHGRDRALFLLNGDRFSVTTARHQRETREGIARRRDGFGADMLIIPFSALDGAGISRPSIHPLEVRPDRHTETLEPIGELDLDDTASADGRTEESGYSSRSAVYTWRLGDGRRIVRMETLEYWTDDYPLVDGRRDYSAERIRTVETFEPGEKLRDPHVRRAGSNYDGATVRLEPDGRWYIVHRRHWLGDSVFLADVQGTRRRRRAVTVADVVSAGVATARGDRDNRVRARNGMDLLRDPLALLDTAAPIVETETVRRRRRFVSSFDNAETRELYYLATLPSSSMARTVADAELDLAPAAVHAAMARGRDVRRQGDIFFIATSLTAGELEGITRARARLTQWTRDAKPRAGEIGYVAPLTAERRRRRDVWTRRLFRDRFAGGTFGPVTPRGMHAKRRADRSETLERIARLELRRRGEILRGEWYKARSTGEHVRTARNQLAGLEHVRTAHRDAYRRRYPLGGHALELIGDCRLAAMDRFEPGARPLSDRWTRNRRLIAETLAVHGTAHTATEVARCTFGRVYVRGTVRHVPAIAGETWRDRDHAPITLGDGETWYLAVRNTVPRANRDDRR